MDASAAVVSSPTLNPLNPNIDDDDSEYEEIEVEEEIDDDEEEIEEEIAEEEEERVEEQEAKNAVKVYEDVIIGEDLAPLREEDDEDVIGEDLTPLREEENQVIDMDLEDPDEHIQTVIVTQGIPQIDIPTAQQHDVGHLKTSELSEKQELHVNGERTSNDDDPKAPLCGSGIVNHEKDTLLVGDYGNIFMSAPLETKATTEAPADIRQTSPRFREPSSSAELDRENKRLKIVCEFHAKGWCVKGNSCRFLHIKDGFDAVVKINEPLKRQASSSGYALPQQSETEKLLLRKDDTLGATGVEDRVSFENDLYLDSMANDSLFEKYSTLYNGNLSGFSVSSRENDRITRVAPFRPTIDGTISKKNNIDLPYTHSRQPLSIGSSSWNTDAWVTQTLLKRGNISPVPCSESEISLRDRILRDIIPGNSNKTKSSSDYWAPSSPFRPSHTITQKILMKENLYDPIRESVEQQTEVKDELLKFSHSDQGSSVKDVNMQLNSSAEEDKFLDSVQVGDNTVKDNNINKLGSSCDNKLKNIDEQRHKKVLRVDKNKEIDVDTKRDGRMQNELKSLKYFQLELIEFVKELLKPTWHEGLLSRDAHKMIVKKAVDKVISTIQPHQIPGTGETIKLYLSSSEPKLAKLVEAYIEKYGKI
ncbi:hsp70 nucleotide exchange factor fes1 [Castilleja foliolosa]|uniref:Hsp70 nucleotide exchange factor fes1 n=1 Tax=Castilleja foliolosa TaxID=1961234 RepID=A0ABD3DNI4_9LAMI